MNVLRWSTIRGFRLALCLVVSAVCLYLAVRGMDFERTVQELRKSSPTPILGAVFFLFLSYWIRAYRWSYLLLPIKKIATRPLFRSTLIGFMGNYLLPFRAGEVMRAVSVGQNQNISKAAALGSILVERVFDGVVLSLTPFIFLAVLDLPRWILWVNLSLLMVYVTGLLMIVLATRRGWIEVWLNPMTGLLPRLLGKRVSSIAGDFLQGMKGINRAGALFPVWLLSLLCWFFHGLYFFLLFEALDLELSFGGGAHHPNGDRTRGHPSGGTRLYRKLRILRGPGSCTVRYRSRSGVRVRTTCAHLSIYSRDGCGSLFHASRWLSAHGGSGGRTNRLRDRFSLGLRLSLSPMSVESAPTISVIIPVYNGAAYLNSCLKAVAASDYRSYECIVVDDGSTDGGRKHRRAIPNVCAGRASCRRTARSRLRAQPRSGSGARRHTFLPRRGYCAFFGSAAVCRESVSGAHRRGRGFRIL